MIRAGTTKADFVGRPGASVGTLLESRGVPATDNRDYRWSSTPDADRCAVFGIRLGQRPSEPRDLADRLRPAAILQLPDTRRA